MSDLDEYNNAIAEFPGVETTMDGVSLTVQLLGANNHVKKQVFHNSESHNITLKSSDGIPLSIYDEDLDLDTLTEVIATPN